MDMCPLKAITLWQPWASLWVAGIKKVETRSWKAFYRGIKTPTPILIHAAARTVKQAELDRIGRDLDPTTEKALGLWQPGRWAWYSSNFQRVDSPIKCRGKQLFWTPEQFVLDLVQQQLKVNNVA